MVEMQMGLTLRENSSLFMSLKWGGEALVPYSWENFPGSCPAKSDLINSSVVLGMSAGEGILYYGGRKKLLGKRYHSLPTHTVPALDGSRE